MKLNIKNYKKIIGVYSDILIVDVIETTYTYYFICRSPNDLRAYPIPLERLPTISVIGDVLYGVKEQSNGKYIRAAGAYFFKHMDSVICLITESFRYISNKSKS